MKAKSKVEPIDSIYAAGEAIGDAWSWMILREAVFHGVSRFNEFQERLGISRETLSNRLDQLVRGGLFKRQASNGSGTAEYVLMPRGHDFVGCLTLAEEWGNKWHGDNRSMPPSLVHSSCGAPFHPVLCCSVCRLPLEAGDVTVLSVSRASSDLIGAKRQRMPALDRLERTGACGIARTLMFIGDRWSSLVIRECFLGTRRFDHFIARLGVAPNILSNRLGRLVELGALARRPYQDRPVRHEYRLTKKGRDLYPVPLAMLTWGDRWIGTTGGGIRLRHRLCNKPFTAVLSCSACGVAATSVITNPGVARPAAT